MEVDDCHPRHLFFCLVSGCGRGGGGMEALGWRNFDLISLSAPPVPQSREELMRFHLRKVLKTVLMSKTEKEKWQ